LFDEESLDESLVEDEVEDEFPPWLIDCPIFIAAFLAPSIAALTLYLSAGCKSLSLYS
jgi:hypothetical protein